MQDNPDLSPRVSTVIFRDNHVRLWQPVLHLGTTTTPVRICRFTRPAMPICTKKGRVNWMMWGVIQPFLLDGTTTPALHREEVDIHIKELEEDEVHVFGVANRDIGLAAVRVLDRDQRLMSRLSKRQRKSMSSPSRAVRRTCTCQSTYSARRPSHYSTRVVIRLLLGADCCPKTFNCSRAEPICWLLTAPKFRFWASWRLSSKLLEENIPRLLLSLK